MFYKPSFETYDGFTNDIGSWDVSRVISMENMFSYVKMFNHDISSWDVSSVINMEWMFAGAEAFKQDISNWDVSSVITMEKIFSAGSGNVDQNCAGHIGSTAL